MNDETIFDPNEVNEEKQGNMLIDNEETMMDENQNPTENTEPQGKKKRDFKTAGIAGAAGVAGAAIGVLTPVNVFPDGPQGGDDITGEGELESEPAPAASAHLQGHDMPVATGVNDAMSFNQAFAAARHEVGPGGIFVWHGHTYGTYYANEWNAMTPEDRDQYWADVHHTTSHIEYEPEPQPEPHPDPDPITEPEPEPHPEPEPEPEHLVLHEDDVLGALDVDGDGEIDVVVVDANGNETPDIIMDTTGDGQLDTLVLDPEMNDEGELVVEEGSIHNIDGVTIVPNEEVNPIDPVNPLEDNVLVINESEVYDVHENEQGDIDALIVDADGNDELDLVLDTTGDGNMDMLILNPGIDDEGNLVIDESNVSSIGGVVITPDQDLENAETEFVAENQDVDETAFIMHDPDVTIDNHVDMDDFVG